MGHRPLPFIAALVATLLCHGAFATTYYIKPTGSDSASGTSTASAWKTLARANKHKFKAGDRLLLQGGASHAGSLLLTSEDRGSATAPIVIGSYGSGRATIKPAATQHGIHLVNTAGIDITNINVVGTGAASHKKSGIHVEITEQNPLTSGARLKRLYIQNVDISKVYGGIRFEHFDPARTGHEDVRILDAKVHDNRFAGIKIRGTPDKGPDKAHSIRKLRIARVKAYRNTGDPNLSSHSGNGIMVSGVDGGVIERCEAYENGGTDGSSDGGPVGIWSLNSNRMTIQYNISHHNRRGPSGVDGGGFDLDGGSTNSVLQYNYSYDNAGPGYLLAQYENALQFHNNVVRYNVSQNDSRESSQGAINVWSKGSNGGIRSTRIYGNSVYVRSAGAPAFKIQTGGISELKVFNNLFAREGNATLFSGRDIGGLQIFANAYYATGGPATFSWPDKKWYGLKAFRSAKGFEKLSGNAVGFEGHPQVQKLGGGGQLTDPQSLSSQLGAYKLLSSSPLQGRGVTPTSGTVPAASQDFYGSSVEKPYSIGADD